MGKKDTNITKVTRPQGHKTEIISLLQKEYIWKSETEINSELV